jgi:uncharacterized protein YecE (DUF72 family)
MEIHAGTSGYSYKEWKGPFYPEKLPATKMLSYYAEQLSAVEINNTFYRMPKTSVLESWAAQVPDGFRFSVKASRRITHFKRLKEADEVTDYLLRGVSVLGDRLGVLLFQLPPNLKCDLERFDAFLELLPEGTPAAFEFRHASWLDEPVFDRLRARQFALVGVDAEDSPEATLLDTAPFGYLRLRRPDYDSAALTDWALRIAESGWERAFVFFKHEDDGAGPRMAQEFLTCAERVATHKRPLRVRRPAAARRGAAEEDAAG